MSAADGAADARLRAALDLTLLAEDATPADVRALCASAAASSVRPAAVCVWPEHATTTRLALDAAGARSTAAAAVVNFPDGSGDAGRALRETRRALAAGAGEIDLVFPWRAFISGNRETGSDMIRQCKAVCGARPLKAIIETGELGDPALVRELATAALDAGADFVKTSTGRSRVGATLEAAAVILECIRERGRGGLKAAGGIRTLAQARSYFELAEQICGAGWATPATFRVGSSSTLGAGPDR
jgi:deoxyribose-phosphate aldolase